MKKISSTLLALCLVGSSLSAMAHGDAVSDRHSKKPAAVKKEQKEWGIAGDAKQAKRTIAVSMLDSMRFNPARLEVKQGETIKFTIKNTGQVMHEFVIGTQKENEEHAALMVKFPKMEHDEPYMAHVPPGKTGQIVWTFNKPGDFDFACLIPGHYQAGMRGTIKVAAASR